MSVAVTQLCLQFTALSDAKATAARLARVLDLAPFSSVILSGADGSPLTADAAHPMVEQVQAKGIAALLHADAALARTVRADGVHVPWQPGLLTAFDEARDILGKRFIVGAEAGHSRHDAMELAETGADYVGFGLLGGAETGEAAAGHRLDLCAWWAEIFEIPAMALNVETAAEAAVLSAAQIDFLAFELTSSMSDADAEVKVVAMNAARAAPRAASTLAM